MRPIEINVHQLGDPLGTWRPCDPYRRSRVGCWQLLQPTGKGMAKEVLRDRLGRRLGEIETGHGGVQVLRDPLGRRLGEYDPKSNVTRDPLGRRVGEGNLLVTFLQRS